MAPQNFAIPAGSTVLVTGATGYIASYIILRLLQLGFKVRGTVRDLEKAKWLTNDLFADFAEKGNLELVQVPDLVADNAFDEAAKGVSAICHVATPTDLSPDPNYYVTKTVKGVTNALEAAKKTQSVKRFVYTSTAGTTSIAIPNTKFHVTKDTWNDAAVELAWKPPPYEPERAITVYMAAKVAAEREVWKVAKESPHFECNVVNPFTTFGKVLAPKYQWGSSSSWVKSLMTGEVEVIKHMPPYCYCHVSDVGWIHVGALLDPDVKNERFHVWTQGFYWNDILAIIRKVHPDRKYIDDFPGSPQFLGTADTENSLQVLEKWSGQKGWTPFEKAIRENIENWE